VAPAASVARTVMETEASSDTADLWPVFGDFHFATRLPVAACYPGCSRAGAASLFITPAHLPEMRSQPVASWRETPLASGIRRERVSLRKRVTASSTAKNGDFGIAPFSATSAFAVIGTVFVGHQLGAVMLRNDALTDMLWLCSSGCSGLCAGRLVRFRLTMKRSRLGGRRSRRLCRLHHTEWVRAESPAVGMRPARLDCVRQS
jgi:hypothetical protein